MDIAVTVIESIGAYARNVAGELMALFLSPSSFLSFWPMLIALIIGAVVLMIRLQRDEASHGTSLIKALFPADVFLHASSKRDAALIFINEGLLFFLSASSIVSSFIVYAWTTQAAGLPEVSDNAAGWSWAALAAYTVFMALVWDFAASYTHYLKHRVPILWEFHKVHHSAERMTPLTALRRHPVEAIVSTIIVSLILGLAMSAWALIFGRPGSEATLFGLNAGIFAWRLAGYNLRHSHIWIDYGPFWSRIFISPAQHQIHHSDDPKHFDSNFGHIFAFWDSLFGTLYVPQGREEITLGLAEEELNKLRSIKGLYVSPITSAAALLMPGKHQTQTADDHAV